MAIVIARSLLVYFSLMTIMRLLGKRQLGEMELSEFVVAALIADLAAHPLQDMGIPLLNGLLPILVLFCCEVLIAGASMKSIRLREFFFGRPSLLITQGKINQQEMHRNRFTADELMQELRGQGCADIARIQYAVLETDGRLNLLLYPGENPVTARQMGVDAGRGGYPSIVISDGRVLEANLRHLGRDLNWLQAQLKQQQLEGPEQVFLMTANEEGQTFLARKEAQT